MSWQEEALKLSSEGVSGRKIAEILGKGKSTINTFLAGGKSSNKGVDYTKPSEIFSIHKHRDKQNDVVLLISDLHIPYHHEDSFEFLRHLKSKYNPTRVICLGDELDKHALSFHDSDPDLYSAGDELKNSIPFVQELYEMFPVVDVIESNHGSMVWRKAKANGIPKQYIKSYNDVLGVGDGWKWSFDMTITLPDESNCYFHHGKASDVIKLSQQMGMHAVQGHYHEKFKVDYWGNPTGLYWAMQIGCLIDDNSLAFSYNNVNIKRPIIGTGVIVNSQPVPEPMILDSSGRWIDRVK